MGAEQTMTLEDLAKRAACCDEYGTTAGWESAPLICAGRSRAGGIVALMDWQHVSGFELYRFMLHRERPQHSMQEIAPGVRVAMPPYMAWRLNLEEAMAVYMRWIAEGGA